MEERNGAGDVRLARSRRATLPAHAMTSRTGFGLSVPAVFVLFSAARALLAPTFDLLPQSAYYFTAYAEHPALSYYDHPPMIGWLLWLSSTLFGQTVLAVRSAVFATTLASQLAVWHLARRLVGPEAGDRALVLLTSGGVALLLSFIAVPDVPLLLFWALALLALHRALFSVRGHGGTGPRAGAWLLAGLFMGLAFLSKYTGAFLQAGLLLHLILCREHRYRLRTPWPWASLAIAHLVSLPVYLWNARHGWASFRYQLLGRASEGRFDPDDLLGFLLTQALILLPVAFGAFLWTAGKDLRRLGRDRSLPSERSFLLAFSAPLFLTCIGLSVVTWVKSNWPMPAYVTALPLAATALGRRAMRWQVASGALLLAAAAVQLLWYPVPVRSNDTWFGWRQLAREVETLAERHPRAFVFSADNYKTTAELRFYTDFRAYGMNVLGWNALQYEYLDEDVTELAGRDALFVTAEPKLRPSSETDRYLARAREHFGTIEELEPIRIRRRGEVVRLFRVFLCRDYRPPVNAGRAATIAAP